MFLEFFNISLPTSVTYSGTIFSSGDQSARIWHNILSVDSNDVFVFLFVCIFFVKEFLKFISTYYARNPARRFSVLTRCANWLILNGVVFMK